MNDKQKKQFYEEKANEIEYLRWYKKHDIKTYEKPSVTVNGIIFSYDIAKNQLNLLLIKRKKHPFQNYFALPGGFIEPYESSEKAIIREVKKETNLTIHAQEIEQLYTFTNPHRDPRSWVISIAYLVFLSPQQLDNNMVFASNDTNELHIFPISTITTLDIAFDHKNMIELALQRIQNKMYYEPNKILNLLGASITIPRIRKLFAQFLNISADELDNSNLRKKMMPFLLPTHEATLEKGNKKPSNVYKLKE